FGGILNMFPKARRTGTPSRKNRDFRKMGTNASIFFISTPLSLSFLVKGQRAGTGTGALFLFVIDWTVRQRIKGMPDTFLEIRSKTAMECSFCSQTVQKPKLY